MTGEAPESETSREKVDQGHLTAVHRTYIYTGENLCRLLGLEGEKVVKVEYADGVWHLTTREKK
jgi:hypothetical protein